MTEHVQLFRDGAVATLTLSRPDKLNALTGEMLTEIERCAAAAEAQRARILVVRSATPRAFTVGADVGEWIGLSPGQAGDASAAGLTAFAGIARANLISVAAVDGYCLGGGLELALACDFRVAGASASFAFPEVGIGTPPTWGGVPRLARLLGPRLAKDMVLTRRQVGATEALAVGLVDRLGETADEAANELIESLLTGAPLAQTISKRAVERFTVLSAEDTELQIQSAVDAAATNDLRRGHDAWKRKATAAFEGN